MVETHRAGRAQGGRVAEGGLRAGAGPGSSGAGTALGTEVVLLARGRRPAEDNQDWGPGSPPRGTRGRRQQWGPRDSLAGGVCSSAGTRSSPQHPGVPGGLTGKGGPEAPCRERRAGTPRGRGPAGAHPGRWGPWVCQEMGCRAKGKEAVLMVVGAALRLQGVSPGGPGEAGAAGVEEGRRRPAPGKLWASSSHPGASPRAPFADGTASSWRKSSPETFPRAPRPPGTSRPWPGRHEVW